MVRECGAGHSAGSGIMSLQRNGFDEIFVDCTAFCHLVVDIRDFLSHVGATHVFASANHPRPQRDNDTGANSTNCTGGSGGGNDDDNATSTVQHGHGVGTDASVSSSRAYSSSSSNNKDNSNDSAPPSLLVDLLNRRQLLQWRGHVVRAKRAAPIASGAESVGSRAPRVEQLFAIGAAVCADFRRRLKVCVLCVCFAVCRYVCFACALCFVCM